MEDDCKAEAEYWQNVLFSALSAASQDCGLHTVTGRMRRRSSQFFALAPFTQPGSWERLVKLWQRVASTQRSCYVDITYNSVESLNISFDLVIVSRGQL